MKRAALASLVAAGLVLDSCGDDGKAPTPAERLPNAASLIPSAPAPQPTPTPTPRPVPEDEPVSGIPGGGDGGVSGECGAPLPSSLSRINIRMHSQQADRAVLDATPIVGPDIDYCQQVGYTDGRSFCAVRPDGHPERRACEAALVGRASDTGRYGPTWSANGRLCDGPDSGAPCLNHPDNQYLAFAYGAGTFRACAAGGVCGEITLP